MLDIIIENGRIIDGSGNPWYYGELGIKDGRIADIGKLNENNARQVIDATGLVVCPGFIDMHAHSDVMLLANPEHEAKIRQGVTTELLGQDGRSYAPLSSENLQTMRWLGAGSNGNPDIKWNWNSLGELLARFDRQVAVNVACLVGHGALRLEAMGMENRLPTSRELTKMKRRAAQAMENGAMGMSTALDRAPCSYSDTNELIEISKVIAMYGGIYVVHPRGAYDPPDFEYLRETITICEKSGIAAHCSHFRTVGPKGKGKAKEMLALIDKARGRGIDITIESYPYVAGSARPSFVLPQWVMAGGPRATFERLADPAVRGKIKEELAAEPPDWSQIVISSVGSQENKRFEGKSLAELGTLVGKEPVDFLCDLLIKENLEACSVVFNGHEEDVRTIMTHPAHMVGSDGILVGTNPHPRAYGTYPRYLGRYVRELGILLLEQAIRKMTSLPAQRLKLNDRGLIKKGLAADLVVFNPDSVIDTASYEDSRRFPIGIEFVIVNGEIVVDAGQHTGRLPGRALKLTD